VELPMENVWMEKLAIQELCARYCQTIDAAESLARSAGKSDPH